MRVRDELSSLSSFPARQSKSSPRTLTGAASARGLARRDLARIWHCWSPCQDLVGPPAAVPHEPRSPGAVAARAADGGPGLRLLCPLSPRPKVARWCHPAAGWLLPNCRVHRLPYQGGCEAQRTRCVPAQESAVAWTLHWEEWLKLSAYTVVCSWDSLKVLINQGFYLLFYNTF